MFECRLPISGAPVQISGYRGNSDVFDKAHRGKYGVRHNNQYRLDADPKLLLLVESWPVVPECSQLVCSITS